MEWTFNEERWKWLNVMEGEEVDVDSYHKYQSTIKRWLENASLRESNHLHINTEEDGFESISGSLIYEQKLKDQNEYQLFHYFLTKDFIITINLNPNKIKNMNTADNAIEGMLLMLSELLNTCIDNIDKFELRLNDLFWKIKKKNSINRLEEIYELRHEALVWKNFMIPFEELRIGLEEAFGDIITGQKEFKRTTKKMERGNMLIKEYMEEIDHLVNFEEMVSNYRGNEIIKTLTVITTLFTPVSAWGALWGMNFTFMPELDEKWGYAIALLIILLSTLAVYLLLIKRGWTGDTLRVRKKNTFFK
ncbi:magnesium transporter CorA family protein [Cytobacillus horneckiae]|uniref:magnesium transporter CorA family protein n=1 Tax=Cytobacillus horneckiae TaxID=549687 RepID=UPI003D1FB6A7